MALEPAAEAYIPYSERSIATHRLDAGVDLAFVQNWLGHANIQNTLINARLTTAGRDTEARRLFASPWIV